MPGVEDIRELLDFYEIITPAVCDWCNRLMADECAYLKTDDLTKYTFCDETCAAEWYADCRSRSKKALAEAENADADGEVTADATPTGEDHGQAQSE